MTMPGVSCKALATQNSSEWPCSMCPIPPGSGLWEWGHPIYFFLIFPGHLEFWTPLQIPSWGPPLGSTLLQFGIVGIEIIFFLMQNLHKSFSNRARFFLSPVLADWSAWETMEKGMPEALEATCLLYESYLILGEKLYWGVLNFA